MRLTGLALRKWLRPSLKRRPLIRAVSILAVPTALMLVAGWTPFTRGPAAPLPRLADAAPTGPVLAQPGASTPSDSPSRPSFNTESDLWRLAMGALQSTDEATVLEALVAARECNGLKRRVTRIKDAINQLDLPERLPRRSALDAALQRCRGFFVAGNASSAMLLNDLSSAHARSALQARLSPSAVNRRDIEQVLSAGGSAAVEHALLALAERWAHQQDNSQRDQVDRFRDAALMAACELNKDCGKDALQNLLLCAETGVCRDGVWSARLALSPEGDRANVLRFKQEILSALSARDFAYFGLSPG